MGGRGEGGVVGGERGVDGEGGLTALLWPSGCRLRWRLKHRVRQVFPQPVVHHLDPGGDTI